MIELAGVSARGDLPTARGAARLSNVDLRWERGVLAILGAPYDGTTLLLSLLAGRARPRTGRVVVGGGAVHVPVDVVLPEALRVEEVCEVAADVRGEPRRPAPAVLGALGLESLARRRARSLSPAEARGVALAVALSSTAPVLLVEEPLSMIEPTVPSRIVEALRARAADGACVVVTTASVRDGTRLADELAVLTRGAYSPLSPALAYAGPAGATMRVVVAPTASARTHAAALVAALTDQASVSAIDVASAERQTPISVVAHGPDLVALASAVTRAVAETRIDVEAVETFVLPLDGIRATLAMPRAHALPSVAPPPAGAPA